MDRLEEIITNMKAKREVVMNEPEKRVFAFNSEDLRNQIEALDEFKTRHRTITDSISETYKTGNAMLDFLENQIILDYHFRGE